MKNNILFTIAGLLSFLSSVAIADTSVTEQPGLEKMIQARVEQQRAAEDKKYAQLIALAGDRQDELAKRKSEIINTYKKWHDLKSAVEASPNKANFNDYRAIEAAAQAHSEADKALVALQKDILVKASVPYRDHAEYLVATQDHAAYLVATK